MKKLRHWLYYIQMWWVDVSYGYRIYKGARKSTLKIYFKKES